MANGNDPANIAYIIVDNGFYYVAYKEKAKVPEVVVSAKGVANGLSEDYNDGWDFGPDSYDPDSTASIPYTQTTGIQEAVTYIASNGGGEIEVVTGEYIVNTTISILSSHIHIHGKGTIIPSSSFSGNAYGDVFVINVDEAGFLEDISIDGLKFDFKNLPSDSSINVNGIHVKYTNATTATEYYNIRITNISGFNLPSNSTTYYANNALVYVTATNTGPTRPQGVIINNVFAYNSYCIIQTAGTSGVTISNVTGVDLTGNGIMIGYGNYVDNSINFGPDTTSALVNINLGNAEYALPFDSSNNTYAGLYINASAFTVSNVIVGGFGTGIVAQNPENEGEAVISNAVVMENSGQGITLLGNSDTYIHPITLMGVTSYGNGFGTGGSTGESGSGLVTYGASFKAIGCMITGNNGYGLYVANDNNVEITGFVDKFTDFGTENPNGAGAYFVDSFFAGSPNMIIEGTGFTNSPTISANPPVSATVYQNTNPYAIEIDLPVYASTSGTAGYVTIAKGSSSSSLTTIGNQFVNGSTSSTSVDIIRLRVPAGWYYEFTASGVTFGTASVFAD